MSAAEWAHVLWCMRNRLGCTISTILPNDPSTIILGFVFPRTGKKKSNVEIDVAEDGEKDMHKNWNLPIYKTLLKQTEEMVRRIEWEAGQS